MNKQKNASWLRFGMRGLMQWIKDNPREVFGTIVVLLAYAGLTSVFIGSLITDRIDALEDNLDLYAMCRDEGRDHDACVGYVLEFVTE